MSHQVSVWGFLGVLQVRVVLLTQDLCSLLVGHGVHHAVAGDVVGVGAELLLIVFRIQHPVLVGVVVVELGLYFV